MVQRGMASAGAPRLATGRVTVWIEPPEGWGPTRILIGQLEQLGYHVEEHRLFDVPGGRSLLRIT